MPIRRTLAAVLATTAIAAPAASAQPADMHASTVLAAAQSQQQDFRSPDAIDAALHPSKSSITVPASPGHPSEAANTTPLAPATDEALSTSDGGVDWPTLGLGIAGLVLFMGGVVALATRSRPTPRTRASV